jgi:predicted transcriptional regulator of viral defense system
VGGIAVLAEALTAASARIDVDRMKSYATRLGWAAALRRIGSLGDALELSGLAGKLRPLRVPTSDIELEPGGGDASWRDAKWRVRWVQPREQLANVVRA